MKLTIIALVVILITVMATTAVYGATVSLNNKTLKKIPNNYSFIVIGHIYGSKVEPIEEIPYSEYPSSTLLANIDLINNENVSFIILMGDIIHKSNEKQIKLLKSSFLDKINVPVFNAVGNHEMMNRSLYESHFGNTYYRFQFHDSLFIILDTEIDVRKVTGKQKEFLLKSLESDIKNVFIISHHLVWNKANKFYQSYKSGLYPQILHSSKEKHIVWIAGNAEYPLYYEKVSDNLTYLATSLTDVGSDAMIKVDVGDKITYTPISLTGRKLLDITEYNSSYWESKKVKTKFTERIFNYLGHVICKRMWGI